MFTKAVQADSDWLAARLAGAGMTDFDRANALAMVARGVLLGNMLCGVWSRIMRA